MVHKKYLPRRKKWEILEMGNFGTRGEAEDEMRKLFQQKKCKYAGIFVKQITTPVLVIRYSNKPFSSRGAEDFRDRESI
jgi:hypothetical protein